MPELRTAGAHIRYERAGAGPAVLLAQGAGVCGSGWRPQVEALSDAHELVSFDNRGIGGSTREPGRLTIEDMAADALALMDAAGIERFHLAGHSIGGLVAQQVALVAPQRVKSLAFLCSFARGKQAARVTPAILMLGLRSRIGTKAMRRAAFLRLVMPAAALRSLDRVAYAERLGALFGHDLAAQPAIAFEQLRAAARFDVSGRLGSLARVPTLVVSSAEDLIAAPRFGRELAAAIPGARYVEIADAGHALPIQRADEVNALLRAHFAAADAAPAETTP
jgi:pimeloyl-ACP methyl ester carboxylesterase